jgi:transposase InsO family protein
VKYSFITQHKNTYSIRLMCQVLGVSRNGYYHYCKTENRPNPEREELLELVRQIADSSGDTYGSRRMACALKALSWPVSRQKARGLMREADVRVRHRKKFKVTTNSDHKQPIFPNLVERQFDVEQPDTVYASDITYVWTQQGWLYLAVVLDLFSRRVVGWSMNKRMNAQLVCDALTMAIWNRRPAEGLIVHSDRGSQYASKKYRRLLISNKFNGSMSRKGDCWDNAVVESFFGSLKQERVQWQHYQNRQEAKNDILQYMTIFYNEYRLHSHLGYQSPNGYERQMLKLKKSA